ncbi:MAG: multicopper oxidase domain-containing protein, partial [Gammaproteobacteria bacterium]|nr:multicopper oxidase domain-containing protein [Gammaproteobacteria bacterium]
MKKQSRISAALAASSLLMAVGAQVAHAGIVGVTDQDPGATGAQFELWARSATIVLGDGNSLATWGYSTNPTGGMQYPAPTLIVNQNDVVTVTLHNGLLVPVSAIFPGQAGVTAAACGGSAAGLMALEATAAPTLNGAGGCVTYSFTATKAGTYLYQSGTRPELQVEMGLVGALIVRPTGYDVGTHDAHPARTAYDTTVGNLGYQPTHFDREYLFFLSEMDRSAHEAVDTRQQAIAAGATPAYTGFDDARLDLVPGAAVDPAAFKATLWFMNGRNAPDTMLERSVFWLPNQPYNALARAHAGERVLMRIVGAGRDLHPFHHHGNNAWLIARDGRVLASAAGAPANYPDRNGIPEFDP